MCAFYGSSGFENLNGRKERSPFFKRSSMDFCASFNYTGYKSASRKAKEQIPHDHGRSDPPKQKEKGPHDVALLKPIARLLGISTDELLSFEETLTDEEIEGFIRKLQKELESRDFRELFAFVKETIEEYPNCESLILQAAALLDVKRMETDLPNKDEYEDMILGWYERCLLSEDEWLRTQAADSLFHACIRREEYEKAARYLKYFSLENPERKRKEALVNGKRASGRRPTVPARSCSSAATNRCS